MYYDCQIYLQGMVYGPNPTSTEVNKDFFIDVKGW